MHEKSKETETSARGKDSRRVRPTQLTMTFAGAYYVRVTYNCDSLQGSNLSRHREKNFDKEPRASFRSFRILIAPTLFFFQRGGTCDRNSI